jgi:hypothetical protein
VRMRTSGVNPSDWKSRRGGAGRRMSVPPIIPHSDGAGEIDAVGPEAISSLTPAGATAADKPYAQQQFASFRTVIRLPLGAAVRSSRRGGRWRIGRFGEPSEIGEAVDAGYLAI